MKATIEAPVNVGLRNSARSNIGLETRCSTAIGVVRPQQSGMASGINTTFRQVGIATGIAGLGAIFQSRVQDKVMEALAGTPVADRAADIAHGVAAGGGGGAAGASPAVKAAARNAFISGLNELFVIGAVVAFAGALFAFVLVRQSDFVGHARQSTEAPAEVPA